MKAKLTRFIQNPSHRVFLLVLFVVMALGLVPVLAAPQTQAGAYRVELQTEPATVLVGKAKLRLKVTDATGSPVKGAEVRTLTRMPGMTMGEREETASSRPNEPGLYIAPAAFPMGGAYVVDLKIDGPQGSATGAIELQTGQNTIDSSSTISRIFLPLAVLLLAAFVVWRMRRTGQKLNWSALWHWQTAAGIAVLLVMFFGARYAVNNLRRLGSMTPLEAQGMEMNMPAPEGVTAVELATVQVKPIRSTVRYTGQAVGYIEQAVYARVTGNLLWMPLYAGDVVKRGQLLARLDRSQIEPQLAGQRAAQTMAQEGAGIAQLEYEEALGAVQQAKAELAGKTAGITEARSAERVARAQAASKAEAFREALAAERKARAQVGNRQSGVTEAVAMERRARAGLREAQTLVRGARSSLVEAQNDAAAAEEELADAQAATAAFETQVPDAQAQLAAAQAEVEVETRELERLEVLVREGIVSRRDFERQQAQVESAKSRVKQAGARIFQAQAEVRGAQARARRAEAILRSAGAREQSARAAIEGAAARVDTATADIAVARARIVQQRLEVTATAADVSGASARIQQMRADTRAAWAEVAAAQARIRQAESELGAHHARVRQMQSAAASARRRISQAQAGAAQARAAVAQVTTTAGYTEIRSLLDGIVTERLISPGTLVGPGQPILKLSQIAPIRLQANVAAADLSLVQVGSLVTANDRDQKGRPVTTRITTVAPVVDPLTRTGVVEAIVSNSDRRFKPGAYVVMDIATGQSRVPLSVPVSAVQRRSGVGTSDVPDSYVWVAEAKRGAVGGQTNQFTVRRVPVETGVSDGRQIEIRSGLRAGQQVVTVGYQNLSEGDMVMSTRDMSTQAVNSQDASTRSSELPPSAAVVVTEKGFEPAKVTVRLGAVIKLTFTRKTESTCATEVVMPEYNINRKLPLNEPVTVEFTPKKTGTLTYACGMDMIRGQVVVR